MSLKKKTAACPPYGILVAPDEFALRSVPNTGWTEPLRGEGHRYQIRLGWAAETKSPWLDWRIPGRMPARYEGLSAASRQYRNGESISWEQSGLFDPVKHATLPMWISF